MSERATRSLGWLHLTDLHVGQPREGGRLANIEREFLADLDLVVAQTKQPIRIVFFSGDIAFRGIDGEYVRATAMLGRICNHIRRLNAAVADNEDPTPVLVPVPGNHDLARPSKTDAETIRTGFASRTAASPPLWEPGQRGVDELIQRSFAAYSGWLRHHPLPFPPGMHHGLLPGDLRATIERDGVRVGVLGLNTSYLHLADESPGSLHLDLSQVTDLLGSNMRAWVESHDLCVLVTHHPPSWLSEVARTTLDQEIKPDALFDLHLFGHEHMGSHRQDPGSAGIRHLIEGRSLFGAEEAGSPRIHGYVVGTFRVETDGRKRTEVFTRQGWRDGHGWRFGPGDTKWGSWRLQIELGRVSPRAAAAAVATNVGRATPTLPETLGDLSSDGRRRWHVVPNSRAVDAALRNAAPQRRWIYLAAGVPYHVADPIRRVAVRRYLESARPDAILAFVRELAGAIGDLGSDFGLVFGGHPQITQAIAPTALRSHRDAAAWLGLVQDEHYWHRMVEEVGVLACSPAVVPMLVPTLGTGLDLARLRTTTLGAESLIAAVFVGGMDGVVDDFVAFSELQPGKPRYCVGLGGGAAAELLLDNETAKLAAGRDTYLPDGRWQGVDNTAKLWHTPALAVKAILAAIQGTVRGEVPPHAAEA
jgi:hypothetical protein